MRERAALIAPQIAATVPPPGVGVLAAIRSRNSSRDSATTRAKAGASEIRSVSSRQTVLENLAGIEMLELQTLDGIWRQRVTRDEADDLRRDDRDTEFGGVLGHRVQRLLDRGDL